MYDYGNNTKIEIFPENNTMKFSTSAHYSHIPFVFYRILYIWKKSFYVRFKDFVLG